MKKDELEYLLGKIIDFANESDDDELHRSYAAACLVSVSCGFYYYPAELHRYFGYKKGSPERKEILTPKAAATQKVLLENIETMFSKDRQPPFSRLRKPKHGRSEYYSGARSLYYYQKEPQSVIDTPAPPNGVVMVFRRANETDYDNKDLVSILMHVMFFLKPKSIKRCRSCNKVFVAKNHPKQIFCDAKCRQDNHQNSLSESDKARRRKQQRQAYRDKKLSESKGR